MHFLSIVLLVQGVFAETSSESDAFVLCDGVIFRDVYYVKKMLFDNLGKPYNLMMHELTGYLYFSHTIHNGSQVDFGITACHIEYKTCHDINGVPGGYAIAYNRSNDLIFFGGHDGIYKYNYKNRTTNFWAEKGKSIWGLFIRKKFYYIEYPSQQLYVKKNRVFVKVRNAIGIEIETFFTSKDLNVYFSTKNALYKVYRANTPPVLLKNDIVIKQITEDVFGDVYFCASDGIYMERRPYDRLKKVADIENAYGITFLRVVTDKEIK